MFDEIPEREYTIHCEGYFNKNSNPLDDKTTIKYLTSREPVDIDDNIELCDLIDYRDYDDDYHCKNHNKYDLRKITKQIRSKKFICEAPIDSGKSTAIRKLISSHKTEVFMVIVPTVNIAEEFYTKLSNMNVKPIRLGVNDNAFNKLIIFFFTVNEDMATRPFIFIFKICFYIYVAK